MREASERYRVIALTVALGLTGCSGDNDGEGDDGRCRDGACCAEGERMADGYPLRCPHGGLISACERPGANCMMHADDGTIDVNCGSPNCEACSASQYGSHYDVWCSHN